MKTQTIRYTGGEYQLSKDGTTLEQIIISGDYDDPDVTWEQTVVKIGAALVLISTENVSLNNVRSCEIPVTWRLRRGPIGGNSNPDITRYHGWRGTTNDHSVYAHGLRRVLKMRSLKNGSVAVTVGPDIHPEWE